MCVPRRKAAEERRLFDKVQTLSCLASHQRRSFIASDEFENALGALHGSKAALGLLEFWPAPVPLCCVAHDEAHHASRQHDLEIIAVLHLGDDECQEQSDAETEHNAQHKRMHLA